MASLSALPPCSECTVCGGRRRVGILGPVGFGIFSLPCQECKPTLETRSQAASEQRNPHIAIVGERGVGKSSLINSLRGLRPTDFGAAEVGVDEVVSDEQEGPGAFYTDGILIYKDIPGCHGNRVNEGMGLHYIQRYGLDTAMCCVFVYTSVLSADTCRCASILDKRGIHVFFVRNKVDIDCSNAADDAGLASEAAALDSMRKTAKSQLKAKHCDAFADDNHIFLVSSKYSQAVECSPPKFDFERLKNTLQAVARHHRGRDVQLSVPPLNIFCVGR